MHSDTRSHTILHLSYGTAVLAALFCMGIGLAILAAGALSEPEQTPRILPRLARPGIAGNDATTMEATYGPLNKGALNESKEGLLSNLRARRTARRCGLTTLQASSSPVAMTPALQSVCFTPASTVIQPLQPYRTIYPVYSSTSFGPSVLVDPVHSPNDRRDPADVAPTLPPLNRHCPDCLDIAPARSTLQGARQAVLESTFGPLNRSALEQVKQSRDTADTTIQMDSEFLTPADASSAITEQLGEQLTAPERSIDPEPGVPLLQLRSEPFRIVPSK